MTTAKDLQDLPQPMLTGDIRMVWVQALSSSGSLAYVTTTLGPPFRNVDTVSVSQLRSIPKRSIHYEDSLIQMSRSWRQGGDR